MKVLYVLGNYPKISETYITAEIAFMLRQGVNIQVWSSRVGTQGMMSQVPVHRESFLQALRAFRPDVVHVHYLMVGDVEILTAGAEDVPVTIRGHSYDFTEENVKKRLACKYVKRIYLFPHFADKFKGEGRVVSLPVAFDSTRFRRHLPKDYSLVLRTCAAKPTKGIEDFLRASILCPKHRFVLLANSANDDWMPTLRRMVKTIGRVELHEDISNDLAKCWTEDAGIYLDTSDAKGHQFGMPISIAEAMATGSLLLIRDSREARNYAGPAAVYYTTVNQAAAAIRDSATYNPSITWPSVQAVAVKRSEVFKDEAVLPRVLVDWRELCLSLSR